jgi:hypothetical protein
MDRIVTGMTVDDIKKTTISKDQENLVKGVSSENLANYNEIKGELENILPVGNKILIKVTLKTKTINGKQLWTGSKESATKYQESCHEIVAISDYVKSQEQWKALEVGDKVKVNMALLVHVQGNNPCLEWQEKDDIHSIWAIQPDRIEYAFKGGN